jgi:hypothetical protein
MMGHFIKAALSKVTPNANKHFISLIKEHFIEARLSTTKLTAADNYIRLSSITKAFGKTTYPTVKADKFTPNIPISKGISTKAKSREKVYILGITINIIRVNSTIILWTGKVSLYLRILSTKGISRRGRNLAKAYYRT